MPGVATGAARWSGGSTCRWAGSTSVWSPPIPQTYRHFADAGLFAFVRDGWQNIFMAHPTAFGLLLAAGETVLGILLLLGGRAATYGWAGVVGFHLLLMLFGFGVWLWCIPALAVLIHLARLDTTTAWAAARASRNAPSRGEST